MNKAEAERRIVIEGIIEKRKELVQKAQESVENRVLL